MCRQRIFFLRDKPWTSTGSGLWLLKELVGRSANHFQKISVENQNDNILFNDYSDTVYCKSSNYSSKKIIGVRIALGAPLERFKRRQFSYL